MMQRSLIAVIIAMTFIFSFALVTSSVASAADAFSFCSSSNTAKQTDVCKDVKNSSGNTVIDTLKKVINIVSFAVGVAAVIILIISGLRMVLSGDDANAVAQARSGIIYALAGIAVTVLAQGIVVFVLNRIK